jgi:uncharacterized protein YgbK (DUF1537 family)
MRVVQVIGVPRAPLAEDVDAVVVALKSRTIAPAQAIAQSLAALAWLRAQGAGQIYFKYCSTFDSTPRGNIGPVTEALMEALGTDFTIACPAFPENRRTVFKGYLFAGDVLLSESGMQNHPLTPMTDSNLVRVLQSQSKRKVGLIDFTVIAQGAAAVTKRIGELKAQGVSIAIADAISDADLLRLGPALAEFALVTAGSGVAIGLPQNWGIAPTPTAARLPPATGLQVVVSGSCSLATRGQVQDFIAAGGAAFAIDPVALAEGKEVVRDAIAAASREIVHGPVLVYSTAEPEAVRAVQERFGTQASGENVEHALAAIAVGLAAQGARQFVVAGGETSGAVVQALGVESLRIGAQIDPGVPWCAAFSPVAKAGVHLALKSGNFGTPDFFSRAFAMLEQASASPASPHAHG